MKGISRGKYFRGSHWQAVPRRKGPPRTHDQRRDPGRGKGQRSHRRCPARPSLGTGEAVLQAPPTRLAAPRGPLQQGRLDALSLTAGCSPPPSPCRAHPHSPLGPC